MKYRVKFAKQGMVRFLGHLDVMRYFQKALRRIDAPVAYSEGFSPHQILSFASPLGVGVETIGDYFDLEMTAKIDAMLFRDRLNAVMAEGFRVLGISALRDTPGHKLSAMSQVKAAEYRVSPKSDRLGLIRPSEMTDLVSLYHSLPAIPIVKQTAKSEVSFDLKQSVYRLAVDEAEGGEAALKMLLRSSSMGTGNLKPMELVGELYARKGEAAPERLRILRLETYGEKEGELVPLGELD